MAERKVHMRSDRVRLLGFGDSALVMLCGAGWVNPLASTSDPEKVTCGQCRRRMPVDSERQDGTEKGT